MPRLNSGANPDSDLPVFTFPSLTRYQLAHVDNWVNGNFDADWPGSAPTPVPFDQIPVARQAWVLCEAALEACVGTPFYDIFEIPADLVVEDISPENTPQWDSLRTIGLVVALEDEFGVQMNTEDIKGMRTIGAVRRLLRAKGILDV